MPFMLKVRMSDGSQRLAYLADRSHEGARRHADKLLTQEGIEGVQIEEYPEDDPDDEAEAAGGSEPSSPRTIP